ncbi:hypothetical protein ACOME3_003338 [Neoechinorhynchus agilis]
MSTINLCALISLLIGIVPVMSSHIRRFLLIWESCKIQHINASILNCRLSSTNATKVLYMSNHLTVKRVCGNADYILFLNASYNQIKNIYNVNFDCLPRLAYLDLSHNQIQIIFEHDFGSINRCIRMLNLRHNMIESVSRTAFLELPELKQLYLSNNPIRQICNSIFHLKKLRILDISETQIKLTRRCFQLCGELRSL